MNHIVCATQYIGPRSALLPSWVPAAGELKNISGDIAQTFDSQVASWYADDLLSARKMLTDFSGKCFNPYFGAYGAVLAHGGGHSATNDNSVYAFDLNDLKWKRISTPTNFGGTGQNQRNVGPVGTNQVNVTTGEYTVDNQAASFHSYDQMELIPPGSPGLGYGTFGGLMTVLRGAVQVHWSGNIKCAHVLRINSLSTPGTWERHSTGNDARTWNEGYGYSTAYDSDRGVIWYTSAANATNDRIALYDVGSTNYLFTYNIPAGHRLAADSNSGSMRYDKVHEALIHTGNGVSGVLIDYMLCNSPGAGWTPAPLSASIPSTGAYQQCPMCYVPERNVWLLITAADPTVVYEIAIPQNITQTWTVTTRGLTGVTSMPWTNSFFSKGWMYNERLKCITIIIDHQTIYAYRPWGT